MIPTYTGSFQTIRFLGAVVDRTVIIVDGIARVERERCEHSVFFPNVHAICTARHLASQRKKCATITPNTGLLGQATEGRSTTGKEKKDRYGKSINQSVQVPGTFPCPSKKVGVVANWPCLNWVSWHGPPRHHLQK